MTYNDETLSHYGIKTAAREKSDLKKAIGLAKDGKWPDAVKIVTSIGKTYSKDRDFTALVADFTRLAKEHMKDSADQNEFDKHHSKARKEAIKIMEKLLEAFRAGYPDPKGVKLMSRRAFNDEALAHYGIGNRKTAHAGSEILWRLLDQRDFFKLYKTVEKQDKQSAQLLKAITDKLSDSLKIKDNEYNAISRLTQMIKGGQNWDISLQRNNIFKAADLMGIRLPSGSF